MNRKGFTLIEVIGVVTVLSIILIVAVPALTKTLKRNEQNKYNDYIENLEMAAENYVIDKLQEGEAFNDYMIFSMGDLIDAGYIKEIMTNPETKEKITRDYKIKVTRELDGTFKYEIVNPTDLEENNIGD